MSRDGMWGGNLEIQALREIYGRSVEIYVYSSNPMQSLIAEHSKLKPPIRLSYHANAHYNAVIDPEEHRSEIFPTQFGAIEDERINLSKLGSSCDSMQAMNYAIFRQILAESRKDVQFKSRDEHQKELDAALLESLQSIRRKEERDVNHAIRESLKTYQTLELSPAPTEYSTDSSSEPVSNETRLLKLLDSIPDEGRSKRQSQNVEKKPTPPSSGSHQRYLLNPVNRILEKPSERGRRKESKLVETSPAPTIYSTDSSEESSSGSKERHVLNLVNRILEKPSERGRRKESKIVETSEERPLVKIVVEKSPNNSRTSPVQTEYSESSEERSGDSNGRGKEYKYGENIRKVNPGPRYFYAKPRDGAFFIIKSFQEDNVHKSIKYGVWCSTQNGNRKLNRAWTKYQKMGYPVYLFFSVNRSRQFCGVAQMTSSYRQRDDFAYWKDIKWKGSFDVRWVFIKDLPNSVFSHIRLPNNQNERVTFSRDTQEIPHAQGVRMLGIFLNNAHKSSLLERLRYYDELEKQLTKERKRERRNCNSSPISNIAKKEPQQTPLPLPFYPSPLSENSEGLISSRGQSSETPSLFKEPGGVKRHNEEDGRIVTGVDNNNSSLNVGIPSSIIRDDYIHPSEIEYLKRSDVVRIKNNGGLAVMLKDFEDGWDVVSGEPSSKILVLDGKGTTLEMKREDVLFCPLLSFAIKKSPEMDMVEELLTDEQLQIYRDVPKTPVIRDWGSSDEKKSESREEPRENAKKGVIKRERSPVSDDSFSTSLSDSREEEEKAEFLPIVSINEKMTSIKNEYEMLNNMNGDEGENLLRELVGIVYDEIMQHLKSSMGDSEHGPLLWKSVLYHLKEKHPNIMKFLKKEKVRIWLKIVYKKEILNNSKESLKWQGNVMKHCEQLERKRRKKGKKCSPEMRKKQRSPSNSIVISEMELKEDNVWLRE